MSDAANRKPTDDEDLKGSVLESLDALDRRGKLEVLDFSRGLAARRRTRAAGGRGGALLAFAGSIPKENLAEMHEAIEEGCGKVDAEEW